MAALAIYTYTILFFSYFLNALPIWVAENGSNGCILCNQCCYIVILLSLMVISNVKIIIEIIDYN